MSESDNFYLPSAVVPLPGDEPCGRPQVVVWLDSNDDDLVKCVAQSGRLGGVIYKGLHKNHPVFESELSPDKFIGELLLVGVKIDKLFVVQKYQSGAKTIDGFLPLFVSCLRCHKRVLAKKSFSRTGEHLCDACLALVVEGPVEKGDE
jgi:hypothetical protein